MRYDRILFALRFFKFYEDSKDMVSKTARETANDILSNNRNKRNRPFMQVLSLLLFFVMLFQAGINGYQKTEEITTHTPSLTAGVVSSIKSDIDKSIWIAESQANLVSEKAFVPKKFQYFDNGDIGISVYQDTLSRKAEKTPDYTDTPMSETVSEETVSPDSTNASYKTSTPVDTISVPNGAEGCRSWFYSYMGYHKVRSRNTMQYKVLNSPNAWSNEAYGTRMYRDPEYGDRYCIAIGTGFGAPAGSLVDVYLSDGSVVPCMVGDIKKDSETDASHKYHDTRKGGDGSVVEIIVDYSCFSKSSKQYSPIFHGTVEKICLIKRIGSFPKVVEAPQDNTPVQNIVTPTPNTVTPAPSSTQTVAPAPTDNGVSGVPTSVPKREVQDNNVSDTKDNTQDTSKDVTDKPDTTATIKETDIKEEDTKDTVKDDVKEDDTSSPNN